MCNTFRLQLRVLQYHHWQLQEEVVGTSFLAATYLKNINFKGKLYVIGSKAVCQELDEFGIQHTGIGVSQYTHLRDIRRRMGCVYSGFE